MCACSPTYLHRCRPWICAQYRQEFHPDGPLVFIPLSFHSVECPICPERDIRMLCHIAQASLPVRCEVPTQNLEATLCLTYKLPTLQFLNGFMGMYIYYSKSSIGNPIIFGLTATKQGSKPQEIQWNKLQIWSRVQTEFTPLLLRFYDPNQMSWCSLSLSPRTDL